MNKKEEAKKILKKSKFVVFRNAEDQTGNFIINPNSINPAPVSTKKEAFIPLYDNPKNNPHKLKVLLEYLSKSKLSRDNYLFHDTLYAEWGSFGSFLTAKKFPEFLDEYKQTSKSVNFGDFILPNSVKERGLAMMKKNSMKQGQK